MFPYAFRDLVLACKSCDNPNFCQSLHATSSYEGKSHITHISSVKPFGNKKNTLSFYQEHQFHYRLLLLPNYHPSHGFIHFVYKLVVYPDGAGTGVSSRPSTAFCFAHFSDVASDFAQTAKKFSVLALICVSSFNTKIVLHLLHLLPKHLVRQNVADAYDYFDERASGQLCLIS